MTMFNFKNILNENDKTDTMSDDELEAFKECLMVMYEEIYDACKKHGIEVCSSNGTTLGAVRHKGFIPWDDDLDLAMKREDYNRFAEVYEQELKDRYNISFPQCDYNASNRFLQLFRKGTVLKTKVTEKYAYQQMYIDIFPIDYVPQNKLIRGIKGLYCNFCMMAGGTVSFVEYNSKSLKKIMCKSLSGRFMYYTRIMLGYIFNFKDANEWFHYIDRIVQNKKSDYCGIVVGRVHYFGEIIPAKAWFPFKLVEYENSKINVPVGYKMYLSRLYGSDYMKIPPVEKREGHHIAEFNVLENTEKFKVKTDD